MRVARRLASSTDWVNIGNDLPPSTRSYLDTGIALQNGQTYYYKVRAFVDTPCGRIFSAYSNEDPATP